MQHSVGTGQPPEGAMNDPLKSLWILLSPDLGEEGKVCPYGPQRSLCSEKVHTQVCVQMSNDCASACHTVKTLAVFFVVICSPSSFELL